MDSGEREFYTLPESPEAYGFLALGDVHSLPDVWHKVSQRIYENESDALFIVGSGDDPADGSQYDQWIDQFFFLLLAICLGEFPSGQRLATTNARVSS
jgi:hypothetical protein